MTTRQQSRTPPAHAPWYRDKWPWLLAIPPALSVVGGVIVLLIAAWTSDGLVAEDYYKRGLEINKTLAPASIREHAPAPRKDSP